MPGTRCPASIARGLGAPCTPHLSPGKGVPGARALQGQEPRGPSGAAFSTTSSSRTHSTHLLEPRTGCRGCDGQTGRARAAQRDRQPPTGTAIGALKP